MSEVAGCSLIEAALCLLEVFANAAAYPTQLPEGGLAEQVLETEGA